jgi:hypothetical protein
VVVVVQILAVHLLEQVELAAAVLVVLVRQVQTELLILAAAAAAAQMLAVKERAVTAVQA